MNKVCIFGAGGSARETYWITKRCGFGVDAFIDLQNGESYNGTPILIDNFFNPKKHLAVVALGNSSLRRKVVKKILNKYGDVFVSIIDPSCITLSNVSIGIGAVVAPNCILTSDIVIGDFCQLNVGTSIMHDAIIGDFFTTAPGVRINGKIKIGDIVYFGSNACTKEEIEICDNVIVGAGATVVKNIQIAGTYVGVPAKRMDE